MTDVSAQVLCTAALRKLRVIDPSENPNATELDNCFTEMKRMLHTWAAKGMYVFVSTEDVLTLTAETEEYTIGSGGAINSARPTQINTATFVRANGLDSKLQIVGEAKFADIVQKGIGADTPAVIWYETTYPLGTIHLWPPGGGELHLWSRKRLAEPATVGANAVFPEEYQDAIVWELSCRMAPEFIGDPTEYMRIRSTDAMATLRDLNEANNPAELDNEISMLGIADNAYDINGG